MEPSYILLNRYDGPSRLPAPPRSSPARHNAFSSLAGSEAFADILRRHKSHRSRSWSSVRKLHDLPRDSDD